MSITPIYQRIVDKITQEIESGTLKPGDKLPSAAQLCREFGTSNTVVRNAMLLLKQAGLVEGHQGRGIYVAGPRE